MIKLEFASTKYISIMNRVLYSDYYTVNETSRVQVTVAVSASLVRRAVWLLHVRENFRMRCEPVTAHRMTNFVRLAEDCFRLAQRYVSALSTRLAHQSRKAYRHGWSCSSHVRQALLCASLVRSI